MIYPGDVIEYHVAMVICQFLVLAIDRHLPRNQSNSSAVMDNPVYKSFHKHGDAELYINGGNFPWEPTTDNPSPIYDDPDNLGLYIYTPNNWIVHGLQLS